jgi:hypothetical protein
MSGSIRITALVKRTAIIPYDDFPTLLKAHLKRNTNTAALERSGLALRKSTTINWADLETFIKEVCKWGDYAGIAGRVVKNNSRASITKNVNNVISKLSLTPPDLVGALNSMLEIKGLDVSFASKHLRFLFPEQCPVLDSILSDRLFYERSPDGYKSFSSACEDIAAKLNAASIVCPFPGQATWRPS